MPWLTDEGRRCSTGAFSYGAYEHADGGTFHGVSKKHMLRYLDEFTYWLNQRWGEFALFGSVLARAVASPPLPYDRLVAESER